eukprot:TRINITY_DN2850_c0_g1_i4.p1 TRINITY_DN2850_c0_g1~~TRINITY_DN2850_c0_g1_i4.p1  ORF type:complete len:210 (+),score=-3.53 TRINITY_DN2850_c0_g1_i4:379-1008(+)
MPQALVSKLNLVSLFNSPSSFLLKYYFNYISSLGFFFTSPNILMVILTLFIQNTTILLKIGNLIVQNNLIIIWFRTIRILLLNIITIVLITILVENIRLLLIPLVVIGKVGLIRITLFIELQLIQTISFLKFKPLFPLQLFLKGLMYKLFTLLIILSQVSQIFQNIQFFTLNLVGFCLKRDLGMTVIVTPLEQTPLTIICFNPNSKSFT